MIEIGCTIRCQTCKTSRSAVLLLRPEAVTVHDLGNGRFNLEFRQTHQIDTNGWRIDEHGFVRCEKH